jgi:uncharacterized protein
MNDEAQALMAQAEEDLASAKHSAAGGFLRSAISSAYYAMFHAAEALLAERGSDSSSHRGLLATVSVEYIQTKLLPPEHGRHLHRAFERRMKADYEVKDHLPEEMAWETIAWAEAFIAAARELLP